ncbi:hypothetical protein SDC9_187116 [bioreactor metagenome]|uniref:Uncharacterized protein n=1 Tax=bioreactor metagenome TaxID=1076179 RepID=A0A645HKR6_9ZZZZ
MIFNSNNWRKHHAYCSSNKITVIFKLFLCCKNTKILIHALSGQHIVKRLYTELVSFKNTSQSTPERRVYILPFFKVL